MQEWFIWPVSKTERAERLTQVRILSPPPSQTWLARLTRRMTKLILIMIYEFSAGGVVFKKESKKTYILVSQHSGHHGWVFPKGFIGDHIENESKEDTAIREVKEETGALGKILKSLTPVTFWYQMDNEKHKKTVYYFLMEYIGGNITKHDWEMENVEWLEMEKVEERLTYSSDKKVWEEARELIS